MKPDNISLPDWEILKEKYKDNFSYVLDKLNEGYPVQYLIGNVDFLGNIINVDERVLIPRFETEMLVSLVIDYAKKKYNRKINIIDLGTGSGAIAISLKNAVDSSVVAIDISEDALNVAKINALENNAEITFLNASIDDEPKGIYDIIISNPPYIKEHGYVEKSVKDYEPNIALFAKDEGIYFYKKILSYAFNILSEDGLIAFEIGDGEKELLEDYIIKNYPNKSYEFKKDLTGLFRFLFIYNE